MTYAELVEKARETYESEDIPHVVKAWLLANIIYPADESEDEGIRKSIIRILKGETGYTSKEDTDKYVAWLEKQGEQPTDKIAANHLSENPCSNCTNTKGCITCVNGDQKSTSNPRILYSDKVIGWIVANICDFEYYVKLFKKDFGL